MSEISKLIRDDMLHVRMAQEAEERQVPSELAAPTGSPVRMVEQIPLPPGATVERAERNQMANKHDAESGAAVAGAAPCSVRPQCFFCVQPSCCHLQGAELCEEHTTYYSEHLEEFVEALNDAIAKRN